LNFSHCRKLGGNKTKKQGHESKRATIREVEVEGKREKEEMVIRKSNRRQNMTKVHYILLQKCCHETPEYVQFNMCQ
jgi:hypothetical protein